MYKPQWSCAPTKYGPEVLLKFGEIESRRIIAKEALWHSGMNQNQMLVIVIQQMVMQMRSYLVPCSEVCLFDIK